MNKDIIRIAEAMGWERRTRILDANESPQVARTGEPVQITEWLHPNGIDSPYSRLPFSPLTSHNDCHALIEWLNGQHVDVEVLHKDTHSEVVMRWFNDEGHRVFDFWDSRSKKDDNDYRIGVVELTLKILDESDE